MGERPGHSTTTRRCLFVIAGLVALHLALNHAWLQREHLSDGCDVFGHLERQLKVHDHLVALLEAPSRTGLRDLLWSDRIVAAKWPKLTFLASSAGTALVGRSPRTTILFTNTLYTALLLVGLFFLGRRLHGPRTALLACALFALFPCVAGFGRHYGLDYPLAAMVTVTLATLAATEAFCRRGRVIALALVCVLTVMTKLQGVFFIVGPVGYVAVRAVWQRRRGPVDGVGRRAVLVNVALFVGVGLALGLLLLPRISAGVLASFLAHTGSAGERLGAGQRTLANAVLIYPVNIVLFVSPLFVVPALAGLVRRRRPPLLAITLGVGLAVFALGISTRWGRFIVPLMPLLALSAARWLVGLRGRVRPALVTAGLGLGAFQLLVSTFATDVHGIVWRPLARRGIGVSRFVPRPPRPDNYELALGALARRMDRGVPGHQALRVAMLEGVDVGPAAGALVELMGRVYIPRRGLAVVRCALHPRRCFDAPASYHHLVVTARRPLACERRRWDTTCVRRLVRRPLEQYGAPRRRNKAWPVSYPWIGPGSLRALETYSRWRVCSRRRLDPERVHVYHLSPRCGGG